MSKCSICKREIDATAAPILTMGAYGNPRFLCDECAGDIDTSTTDTDFNRIAEAMDRLSAKMGSSEPEELVVNTLTDIMASAADRANKIKDGSYDFSLDAAEEESFDEIPEDMLESEEDKKIEEIQEEKNKKFDKIFNIISAIVFSALGAYLIFVIIKNFFL